MSDAQIAVQSCHAVIECSNYFDLKSLCDHPSVIILGSKSEFALYKVQSYLIDNNVQYARFHEPDIGHQLTAIATEPIFQEKRSLFKKYQLLQSKGGK